jgi:NADH-quinone oxidoreductase subunit L
MFFMLTLILANNYLLMFVGWEGVGLASYLLIGFWFLKDSAANAGKKAFIANRVGDFGFLIALFLLIKHFGTLQYNEVFQKLSYRSKHTGYFSAIGLLMMVAEAVNRRNSVVRVAAAAGRVGRPTPVSADSCGDHGDGGRHGGAISASVQPGLIALTVVAVIGTLTAIFASISIVQTDIRRCWRSTVCNLATCSWAVALRLWRAFST